MIIGNCSFNKKKKYILACSFGPDSMALFDMLHKKKCQIIVCFVNYNKRKESVEEQKQIVRYCFERKIKCEVLSLKDTNKNCNFQSWARKIRYDFFSKISAKYNVAGVFVAHNQDDHIETYIMQKENNKKHIDCYGLKKYNFINNMLIIRPLLCYSKQELLNYCKKNKVPFSIDKSNFDVSYCFRNKVRHAVINKLNVIDRLKIIKEIDLKNRELKKIRDKIKRLFDFSCPRLNISEILNLNEREFDETIMFFLKMNFSKHIDISPNFCNMVRKICLSKKPNIKLMFKEIVLLKEYDELLIIKKDDFSLNLNKYSYIMKKPGKLSANEIDVDFSSGFDKKIFLKDYPIMIRSPYDQDHLEIKQYKCKLKKLFIDWKMPIRLRKMWPVFCDKNGKVIYVPRYRKGNYKINNKIIIKLK